MFPKADCRITKHCAARIRQRGIRERDVNLHAIYSDHEKAVGDGCVSYTLSNKALKYMQSDGVTPQEIDRVKDLASVRSSDGRVVTVMHMHGQHSRRYRK